MSEKNISNRQRKKIEEIKKEWINDIKEISEKKHPPGIYVLDGGNSGYYTKLSKKYLKMIQEVLEAPE
nr:MAG TPA: hypothetical protein [Caudoviricetes sp.]